MQTFYWQRYSESRLLKETVSRLGLQIEQSALEPLIEKLYGELTSRGLAFEPPCFLADEWFCPVGVPAIGIPFYLAHARLRKLEKKMILDVEGGSSAEFMKLMRHEAGHAYSYAYGLFRKAEWRRLFGSAAKDYPDTYHPRPFSRSYVIHLDNWYAQSHPDEDFAETFAVWLTPGLDWRKRYRGWKALEKLDYVDRIMKSLPSKPPICLPPANLKKFAGLNMRLSTYFKRKMKLYEDTYPHFYDRELKVLFTDKAEESSKIKAADYLRQSQDRIVRAASFWTKEKRYTIDQFVKRLIRRSGELGLFVKQNSNTDVEAAAFISTLVTTYLFTGKFKRSK
jgi:hypothetical protein